MALEELKSLLPEYAKDTKLNLSTLASDETLTGQQLWGCWLASAVATRHPVLIAHIKEEASKHLSAEAIHASLAAATIMGMNNIYYRFTHLASNHDYRPMQAKLRMNVIGNPGVDKIDFELWSLAVSALNGCGMCIDSHEQVLLKHGVTKEHVQTSVRIASVLNAAATALSAEGL